MIIINTTFILDPSVKSEALAWVKNAYAAEVAAERQMLTRIIAEEGEGGYAMHLQFEDMEAALDWDRRHGAPLRSHLTEKWGERALAFCTFLETVE